VLIEISNVYCMGDLLKLHELNKLQWQDCTLRYQQSLSY
jgi:hypothetical protein